MLMVLLVCATCNTSIWQLEIGGIPVEGLPEMTEEQCSAVAQYFDAQTPAFTQVECVEYPVERQDS